MKSGSNIAESFFDGFGPIGLFFRPHIPGGPTEPFEAESEDLRVHDLAMGPLAGTVVGTGVLTVVGKIIGSRLSKR